MAKKIDKTVTPGKFRINQQVYHNNRNSTIHGKLGTIVSIDANRKTGYPYEVRWRGDDWTYYHPESELSSDPLT
ncbi:hypothetical protein Rctr71_040 [Virus Rctr71]|nr:hypothetical protein Rctr71_040 [Virus Rctr71]